MAQHLLLRVSGKFATSEEFYAQLERSIRSSDIAGLGTDENVYLLLNQATEENLPLLTQRMAEKGFQVTSVSLDGQHRLIAAAKKDPANECKYFNIGIVTSSSFGLSCAMAAYTLRHSGYKGILFSGDSVGSHLGAFVRSDPAHQPGIIWR